MLNVMFCAKSDNLPQLTVAMSSFLRHNPNSRVHLFCDDQVDRKAVERLAEGLGIDASIRVMRHKYVELAALDYMICETSLDRVLFMGDDTLTQGSVADLEDVELGADSALALVSSIWPFWEGDVRAPIYREVNFDLDDMRGIVSTNYFSTSMFMLSLDRMRKISKSSFCIWGSVMFDRGYEDVINYVIGANSMMYMPTWMTAAVEVEIHDYLGVNKIARYASAVKSSRVVQMPNGSRPWGVVDSMDLVCLQTPMLAYLEAAEHVRDLLPDDFFSTVKGNADLHERYFGRVVDAIAELHSISESMGQ